MNWLAKIRPQVLLLIGALTLIAKFSIDAGFTEAAMACVVGLVAAIKELTAD